MLLVFGLTICFTLAFAAEWIGLAGIVGAFAAGLLLDPYGEGVRTREEEQTLSELLHPLSNLFVPLFFVLMGIQVDVASLVTRESLGFGAALVLVAVARQAGVRGRRGDRGINRLAVGIGMVPRGEVGLIFAGIGAEGGRRAHRASRRSAPHAPVCSPFAARPTGRARLASPPPHAPPSLMPPVPGRLRVAPVR